MAEVTKEDMNRLYDMIRPVAEDVIIIKTKMDAHFNAHNKWSSPVISLIFDFLKMGVVCIVTWYFVKKQ